MEQAAGCLAGPATSSTTIAAATGTGDCENSLEKARAMKTRRLSVVSCDGDELQFSDQLVTVRAGDYDYVDSRNALLGVGSYGAVFRGFDRRPHRKPSVHNNTAVRGDAGSSIDSAMNDGVDVTPISVLGPRAVAVKKVARTSLKPNELRAMKRVRHPNLVRLIDICNATDPTADGVDEENLRLDDGDCSPFTYLIMELCDTDLDRYLRRHTADGRLQMDELLRVVECIACGYFALYEKRIVHRDIKPQNILLNYGSDSSPLRIANAKITDFGISRIYEAVDGDDFCDYDPMNNVAGTFYYMAPEVGANLLRLSEYDYSADLWSIGCLIYQCLTGHIPFDESLMCRLFLYCAGANYDAYDPPDLPEPLSDSGQALNTLIVGLLQIDREKRATPQQLYAYTAAQAQTSKTQDDPKLQPNFSFASLSSVLSTSTLGENSASSRLATPMMSSSDGEEMFHDGAPTSHHQSHHQSHNFHHQ